MRATTISALAFTASLASAHFEVLYPTQEAPFDDELQATGPCGGADPEVNDNALEVTVDQFAVSIRSSHPEGNWAFRATTATSAPYNFTDITPMIESSGVGEFCLTSLSVPSDYAGSGGIIQVVDQSDDGMLFQCIPVNFVEGSNSTVGPACTNATGFSAEYAAGGSSDSGESSDDEHDHDHGTMSMSMSGSASATAAAASSSSVDGAAMVTGVGALAGLGAVVAGLVL